MNYQDLLTQANVNSVEETQNMAAATYNSCESQFGFAPTKQETALAIKADCGDDSIMITNSAKLVYDTMYAMEKLLLMKLSKEDTSLNSGVGNYTEGLVKAPLTYSDSWSNFRSLHATKDPGFLDVPKVRHCLQTKSMRKKFADTIIGKFSDFGKAERHLSLHNPMFMTFNIASAMQDTILSAISLKENAYIPVRFGGGGKPPLFNNADNMISFNKAYKHGTYEIAFNTLVKEVINYSSGDGAPSDLLTYFSKTVPKFRDWVKNDNFVSISDINLPPEVEKHCIGKMPSGPEGLLAARLLKERAIVTESNLKIHMDHVELSKLLSGDTPYTTVMAEHESKRIDWRECDLMSLKSLDKIKQVHMSVFYSSVTRDEVKSYLEIISQRNFDELLDKEKIYSAEALDEIYLRGNMNVHRHMHLIPQLAVNKSYIDYVYRDVPDTSLVDLQPALSFLKKETDVFPVHLINDDQLIIRKARELSPRFCPVVITDDIHLCKRVSLITRQNVLRVPTRTYVKAMCFGLEISEELIQQSMHEPHARLRRYHVFEDTGATASALERNFREGYFLQKSVEARMSLEDHWSLPLIMENVPPPDTSEEFRFPRNWPEAFYIKHSVYQQARPELKT